MTKILVVDDSAVDRRLAGGLLEKIPNTVIDYAVDGALALRRIDDDPPDVVITDLMMPNMNGLELVQAVRQKHPAVPVILMTAQGSEDVAIQALLVGAASYVPKSRLARDLADTVEHVLLVARMERHQERLMDCMVKHDCAFVLGNDPSLIPPLVAHLQKTVTRILPSDETCRMRIGIALEEALLNALYHGNLEVSSELREEDTSGYYRLARQRSEQPPYCDRRIHVDVQVSRESARYVIRDDGPGFNPASVADPTEPANLEKVSGRGLLLIRSFMDEVKLNEQGNQITLVKNAEKPASP
jgi:CheY-like chemotaxis protein